MIRIPIQNPLTKSGIEPGGLGLRLRRLMDSPGGAMLGGVCYGLWAVAANWHASPTMALRAGALHAALSTIITLGTVSLMRGLFVMMRDPLRAALIAAGGALLMTYTALIGMHLALGTPRIALTLAPGIAPTVGFDLFYAYLLAREAGLRIRFRRPQHAAVS